eukprot:7378031-Prymnesium_polylepis.1
MAPKGQKRSRTADDATQEPSTDAPQDCVHRHHLLSIRAGADASPVAAAAEALVGVVPGVISSKLTPILAGSKKAKGFTHQHLVKLGRADAVGEYDAHAASAEVERDLAAIATDDLVYCIDATAYGKLAGKVALVTGSSSGIGKDVALAYAREGCDCVLNYPTGDAAQEANAAEVARQIALLGRQALVHAADITSAAEVEAMVAAALRHYGHLDILVNNAGMASSAPVEEMPEEMWDTMMRVNLKGGIACGPRMHAARMTPTCIRPACIACGPRMHAARMRPTGIRP